MARHPQPAAHRGGRAQVAPEHAARPATRNCTSRCWPACWATSAEARRTRTSYLGARGIKFYRHPGAHLKKKPGRWIVCAELVETTRLFGRGIANIEPLWIEQVAGHLLKKQLLDPHWEKKAAEVMSLERATLYGLVIYSGRRVPFARVDLQGAREIFIREGLVAGQWETQPAVPGRQPEAGEAGRGAGTQVAPAGRAGGRGADLRLLRQVHSARRLQRRHLRALVPRRPAAPNPALLKLTRDELMRHEAAGITTDAFPKTIRLGGVDCAATYLHEPGDAARRPDRDGAAVRAEPGERGARRVAGARHAQGQGAGAAQEPAATAALALRAAARVGGAAGRRSCRSPRPGRAARSPTRCSSWCATRPAWTSSAPTSSSTCCRRTCS